MFCIRNRFCWEIHARLTDFNSNSLRESLQVNIEMKEPKSRGMTPPHTYSRKATGREHAEFFEGVKAVMCALA